MTMRNKTQLWLSTLAAVAVAMLGSPAQAKLWTATYDPPAYVGTGTFDVPDACLSLGDGIFVQSDIAGCTIQIKGNVSTAPVVDFAPILPVSLCASCDFAILAGNSLASIRASLVR